MPRNPLAKTLAGTAAMALSLAASPPEEQPRDIVSVQEKLAGSPVATLRAGKVEAVIALPDGPHGFYRGRRFDWAGMVVRLRLGEHTVYGPWFDGIAPNIRDFTDDGHAVVAGPQTAAIGPAEEFIGKAPDPVPGYAEATEGGTFLKIGVGRLRKPDDRPYSRFRPYEIVDSGHWATQIGPHLVMFRQKIAPDEHGYGYIYEKTLRLTPAGDLEVLHMLRNIGTKAITTQVYNHNFTRLNGQDIVPGTGVSVPFALPDADTNAPFATVAGSTLCYRASLRAGDHVTLPVTVSDQHPTPAIFTITAPDGLQVKATSDTPINRLQIWSVRAVLAVEPFINIDLAPGAEQHWTWRYAFSMEKHIPCRDS